MAWAIAWAIGFLCGNIFNWYFFHNKNRGKYKRNGGKKLKNRNLPQLGSVEIIRRARAKKLKF